MCLCAITLHHSQHFHRTPLSPLSPAQVRQGAADPVDEDESWTETDTMILLACIAGVTFIGLVVFGIMYHTRRSVAPLKTSCVAPFWSKFP